MSTGHVAAASLLAHQGGWDEIALVAGPLAVIAAALWLANRRVTAQLGESENPSSDGGAGDRPTGRG